MTLVSSGVLRLSSTTEGADRSIRFEVEGTSSPPYLFSTAVTNASPTLGALPRKFSDFYGHAQAYLTASNLSIDPTYEAFFGGAEFTSVNITITYDVTNPTGSSVTETIYWTVNNEGVIRNSGSFSETVAASSTETGNTLNIGSTDIYVASGTDIGNATVSFYTDAAYTQFMAISDSLTVERNP